MTISEMHIETELRLQKVGTYAVDNFQREEYDAFLNDAQVRWVKNRFSAFSNAKQKGFEEVVKRLDDLRTLHKEETIETPATSNGLLAFLLPSDYQFFVAGRVDSYASPCGTATTSSPVANGKVRLVETQGWMDMRRNPFAKSKHDSVLAIIRGNNLFLDADATFIPFKVYLEYLRSARIMSYTGNISCELPEHTHTEIVDLAVQLMIEGIESGRFQTHNIVTNLND